MKRLGIRNTMLLAKKYNGLLYGKYHRYRDQIMYGLVSPARADFSDSIVMEPPFTLHDSDSELRRLILDKYYLGKR